MNISSMFSPSAIISRLQVKSTATAGTQAPAAKAGTAPADPAAQQKDEMAALKKEREAYDAQRNTEIRKREKEFEQTYGRKYGQDGDPPLAYQIALPVNERGYQPFVNADQQKQIDAITDKYIYRENLAPMWEELTSMGLNPDQLVKSAKYFISMDGRMATREEATKGIDIKV
ncbi:hypothetical protein [Niveispirillum sp. KHB5.9]|uniref:hypothetical protein n=1 Tax=Niveispirillum sp. KHB5.9 TaxID=3400269 RepID=UPI003A880FC0